MVSGLPAVVLIVATLGAFVWIGVRASRRDTDVEDYVVARNSQPPATLGLSFLAAGMGAWILFAPPEVGALVGMVGVAGYAVGAAVPFAVYGLLGSRIRSVLPAGHSLPEFLRLRFGRAFSGYVAGISVLYMLFFVMAELTAIGAVVSILSGASPVFVIVAVTVATLAYTTLGGLRASLVTDRFQAWLILALLAAAAYAVLGVGLVEAPDRPTTAAAVGAPLGVGIQVAITLVIAVTAANMFHQGYWQRVWAARDDRALRTGAAIGGLATVPVVAVLGYLGYAAASRGLELGVPPAPFFAGIGGAPAWVTLPVLVLALALVASSVDTLQTGLASLLIAERRSLSLTAARVITVALMVPVVVVAVQGFSVLRLFLIADLLCAATVVPALASLWSRATTAGALAGALAGLAGAAIAGVISTQTLAGVALVTMPGAQPTLPPFLGALIASALVTVTVSLAARSSVDLQSLGAQVPALSTR
jgi:Na+/proline symporter